jgi:photosystem II stability/assembly factor-like uncharacterized protein
VSETRNLVHARLEALQYRTGMEVAIRAAIVAPAPAGGPFMAPAVPQTANWTQLGPSAIPNGQTYGGVRVLVTGRVTTIVIDGSDPNTVYAGTAQGGVWKTADAGRTWRATSDDMPSLAIGALVMDPTNNQVLYAGTGEGNFSLDSYYGNGVLRTTDGGVTWTNLALATFAGNRFARLAITPGSTAQLFGATNSGLYRTTDAGTTWAPLTNGLPTGSATDVAIDPGTPTRAYAAFWGGGIYRTTDANAANPTWTKLAGGLPATGFTRIALAISPSSPTTLYALMAGLSNPTPSLSYLVNRFLRSTDAGTTWQAIPLPGGNIGGQGFYNLNVAVDPTTPDIVYLSGVSLWKATRDTTTNTWTVTDIGGAFHPDNHALAIDPTHHLRLYAGSDGGLYRSADGGLTWDDRVNRGLCIAQFEFTADHPTSAAQVLGGTQDNGTEQYHNSPVFYHSDDGDGGSCAIDPAQPNNMLSTYYKASPKRSTAGGQFGSWLDVSTGLGGNALFYPPMALDGTNPNNVAFGTTAVYLDAAQGAGGWPTSVPIAAGQVSALHYVNSNLVYAGTTNGGVYRLTRTGAAWAAQAIHAAPLPNRYVWDVTARPDNPDVVIVVQSGFGTGHVWRGAVATGGTTWTDVSGTGAGRLPDIPVNALAIDAANPDAWYIGTDIGVFRTADAGTTWQPYRNNLPNCAVFDLKLHPTERVLRAATHGRGLWEIPVDAATTADVDLVLRHHPMDTGRVVPTPNGVPANWDDPLQHVGLNDPLYVWQCADVKVDAIEGGPPAYQMPVADVDYLAFESRLAHRNPQRGQVNRVYVQVRNRGYQPALNVQVKVLTADATLGLPPLPADFWAAFPNDSTDTTRWRPVGTTATVPVVPPLEPTVLEWDWSTPTDAADHSCVLVIVDSASDPIPAANRVFDVGTLIGQEKRAGLKNLHVVNAPAATYYVTPVRLYGNPETTYRVRFAASPFKGQVGALLWKGPKPGLALAGVTAKEVVAKLKTAATARAGTAAGAFDLTKFYAVTSAAKGGAIEGVKLPNGEATILLVTNKSATGAAGRQAVTVVQEAGDNVVGGSTFVV